MEFLAYFFRNVFARFDGLCKLVAIADESFSFSDDCDEDFGGKFHKDKFMMQRIKIHLMYVLI